MSIKKLFLFLRNEHGRRAPDIFPGVVPGIGTRIFLILSELSGKSSGFVLLIGADIGSVMVCR